MVKKKGRDRAAAGKLFWSSMTPVLNRFVIVPDSDLNIFSEQSLSPRIPSSLYGFVFTMGMGRPRSLESRMKNENKEFWSKFGLKFLRTVVPSVKLQAPVMRGIFFHSRNAK
jgi:hypothetical protein